MIQSPTVNAKPELESIAKGLQDDITYRIQQFFLRCDDDFDIVEQAGVLNDVLLASQGSVAAKRRSAVRRLRTEYTLREIGDRVGMAHQRIAQIERGADRSEKG